MTDRNGPLDRRTVLKNVGAASALTILPLTVSAKESYPTVDEGDLSDAPLSEIVVDSPESASEHPHHNRIAFSTSVFSDGLELYVADGVDSLTSNPDAIYQ
ncbi:hypothetical protein GCM10009030_21830 [Haloarcula pellucida]|uniref:Uncharacterized protein n=1 Tax=Haloarcula pellucida TaxID=1427151 RepID=A0A830GN94_9EURY|nr:hypothetical protein GCM10009030_21830 [Halomicroarcula pellucida]